MHGFTRVELSFGEGEAVAIAFVSTRTATASNWSTHRAVVGRIRHCVKSLGASDLGWPTPTQQVRGLEDTAR